MQNPQIKLLAKHTNMYYEDSLYSKHIIIGKSLLLSMFLSSCYFNILIQRIAMGRVYELFFQVLTSPYN